MSNSIKISPKYGVNPTIAQCLFCGEQKNEIALLGHIYERDVNGKTIKNSDIEAPKTAVIDYEPCDKCKADWQKGVPLIGVVTTQPSDNRPPIVKKGQTALYPTGSMIVVTQDFADRYFKEYNPQTGKPILADEQVLINLTNQ